MEWGFDRAACIRIIEQAGLPIPVKSACFCCPANKKHEILALQADHPDLLARALRIEENARPKLRTVKGLGRSFAWSDFLAKNNRISLFDGCCP